MRFIGSLLLQFAVPRIFLFHSVELFHRIQKMQIKNGLPRLGRPYEIKHRAVQPADAGLAVRNIETVRLQNQVMICTKRRMSCTFSPGDWLPAQLCFQLPMVEGLPASSACIGLQRH
jgi:hypothetical protein